MIEPKIEAPSNVNHYDHSRSANMNNGKEKNDVWVRHNILAAALSSSNLSRGHSSPTQWRRNYASNNDSTMFSTSSSRWGWVKGSIISTTPIVGISNSKEIVSMSDVRRNKMRFNGSHNSSSTATTSVTSSSTQSSLSSLKSNSDLLNGIVSVIITDPESEFQGKTVQISPEMSQNFDEIILNANSWVDFNSIPERKKDRLNKNNFEDIDQDTPKSTEKSGSMQEPPSDLIQLTHLHEPAVVYCLRHRYALDKIYTSTGPILLALNPFKNCNNLYCDEMMNKYKEQGEAIASGKFIANGININSPATKSKNKPIEKLSPHVFAVADNAFRQMMRHLDDLRAPNSLNSIQSDKFKLDQSILVSGESGAGKTVTTKIIMKYLAMLSKQVESKNYRSKLTDLAKNHSTIEQQVLQSNPILESFGNARTIRNDNSSRFGKFIEIKFSSFGKLIGASIETYLLEKVRLINHSEGERNYHIFYELLKGSSPNERNRLLIGNCSPADFAMTTSYSDTYTRRDGIKDEKTFLDMRDAMSSMGIGLEEQMVILEIISALLHLSNLTFVESETDECFIDQQNPSLHAVLELLEVSPELLEAALCSVKIEVANENVIKKLGLTKTQKALEALIKAIYSTLFNYLVNRINDCIKCDTLSIQDKRFRNDECNGYNEDPCNDLRISGDSEKSTFIGLLDIFGFESFKRNSFEQLCINYCNESLQQHFNQFIFKLEQAEYEKECISWNFISFPDNQNVLDLIDKKKTGILSILDEQCMLSQYTDQSFISCVYDNCMVDEDDNPFQADSRQVANGLFSIQHYAGHVEYDSCGFLEKNKDELPKETIDFLLSSTNNFLLILAKIMDSDSVKLKNNRNDRNYRQSSLRRISVSYQFSTQLKQLRGRIELTTPHYIRCLKPNDQLTADNFDCAIIADQLKYAGILEAIRVSRVGFPQRYSHAHFIHRYKILAMRKPHRLSNTSSLSSERMKTYRTKYTEDYRLSSGTKEKKRNEFSPRKTPESLKQECRILIASLASRLISDKERTVQEFQPNASRSPHSPSPVNQSRKFFDENRFNNSPRNYQTYKSSNNPLSPTNDDYRDLGIQLGTSKVFLRQHAFDMLEFLRGRITSDSATKINSLVRMYLQRKRFLYFLGERRLMLEDGRQLFESAENMHMGSPSNELDSHLLDREEYSHRRLMLLESLDSTSELTLNENLYKEYKWKMIDNRWVKNEIVESFDDAVV